MEAIEATESTKIDVKSHQRHKNDPPPLWRQWVICPSKTKKHDKLLSQSAEKWICMGKMGCNVLGDFIFQASKGPQLFRFFGGVRLLSIRSLKKIEQESSARGKEKINTVSKIFDVRENYYNSAVNTHFWA